MLNNVVAYHIDQDPSPILVLQPTLDMAETWSKDRLAPMIRDTPRLQDKVADAKSRDSGNTLLHKRFLGGHVTIVGANSPSSLASRPIRIVLADEVDRYPLSAGTEGDPLSLAIKRTATFWNRRIISVSTPTIKGHSRIESEWLQSDQRRYHVPCPHCEEEQTLEWKNVLWPEGKPEEAALHCATCGAEWTDAQRRMAVRKGRWIATAPHATKIAGFHINELYSPWSTIPGIAKAFMKAKRSVETLRTWTNTTLGETFEEDSEKIDHHHLADRAEEWNGAPTNVLVVTCGVDVQADRLEIERVGWGLDEESWSLDYHIIYSDPSDPETWRLLDAYLNEPTVREDGREMPIRAVCVDSGGHHTQTVYKYCRLRRSRRIFAIKGRDEAATVWPPMYRARKNKVTSVHIIGVTAAKDAIYSHLKVAQAGPGFAHFPKGRAEVWYQQLVSEQVATKFVRGFPKRTYFLPHGKRNEALDCRVYAYAALQSLAIRWGTELAASRASNVVPATKSLPPPEAIAATGQEPGRDVRRSAPASSRPGFLNRNSRSGWLRR